ncbi:MAG: hypothetical protein OYG31_00100 [Candidatus Kaiserbacteria bacterium]|nr:hypothetical protein [Candidatus Kaiserbacteria bacterium]
MKLGLDQLNNSQMILLVLLVTLVTSSAVSVAVLSVVSERMSFNVASDSNQPTIIQQTIHRIINKDNVAALVESPTEDPSIITAESIAGVVRPSLIDIYFGSQPASVGVFVSDDGAIIASERLQENRRYNVTRDGRTIFYTVVASDYAYSLLRPLDDRYSPSQHIPLTAVPAAVGKNVVIFGGFAEDERVLDGIVSQVQTRTNGMPLIRTSIQETSATLPSVVFVEGRFFGFITDESEWVASVDADKLFASEESAL